GERRVVPLEWERRGQDPAPSRRLDGTRHKREHGGAVRDLCRRREPTPAGPPVGSRRRARVSISEGPENTQREPGRRVLLYVLQGDRDARLIAPRRGEYNELVG